MQTKLVHFKTADKLNLPGILYEKKNPSSKVIIMLHGNGPSSYFYRLESMAKTMRKFVEKGYSVLALSNRGDHWVNSFRWYDKRGIKHDKMGGAWFEKIKECVMDIDAAISFLKKASYSDLTLWGNSSGANKICVYNYYRRRNPVSRYILAAGGDDAGIYYKDVIGPENFKKVLAQCRSRIRQKKGLNYVPLKLLGYPYSYQGLYDVIDPDGDYNIFPFYWMMHNISIMKKEPFREFKTIQKPALVIYGEKDEYAWGNVEGCIDMLKKYSPPKNDIMFKTIKNADHGFYPNEKKYHDEILDWLAIS